uniref:Olfactory receptor n=1 Tax=Pelodiscus sinensis TaxID=13735 RepID=K7F7W6_PELSI
MASPDQGNQTSLTEFILLGFRDLPGLQAPFFLLFLVIYLATMIGNILIMGIVVVDRHLHTPMYFFLGNLSCLETCYSSTILPQLLAGLLTGDRTISFAGCLTQYYFFGALVATECLLLSVMSYDRYVAICSPLHYTTRMSDRSCLQLAGGSWAGGFLVNIITVVSISQLTFCGSNRIDHFFCDFIPLVKLSCNDPRLMETLAFSICFLFSFVPFLVVSIFYGTLMVAYMFPTTDLLSHFKKLLSVAYTVLTPLANPLIYSLRNREVQEALSQARRESSHPALT